MGAKSKYAPNAVGFVACLPEPFCPDASPPCYIYLVQVGDSISCIVYDVEEGGRPLLTQRLLEEADDELADLAEQLEQVGDNNRVDNKVSVAGCFQRMVFWGPLSMQYTRLMA